jgi:hypothetical protein
MSDKCPSGATAVCLLLLIFSWVGSAAGCRSGSSVAADKASQRPDTEQQATGELLKALDQLTLSLTADIFSPPVASRIYAYSSLAAWEALAGCNPAQESLLPLLNQADPAPPAPPGTRGELAAIQAFYRTAQALIFTEDNLRTHAEAWLTGLPPGPETERALQYGSAISEHILAYAAADYYPQTRTYAKHPGPDHPGDWLPTPPLFMGGLEPHWGRLRPFTLDSASQFAPPAPEPFDPDPASEFMALTRQVQEAVNKLSPEQEAIARHWDCNPFQTEEQAHLMAGQKKMTPGGHWMAIAALAARQSGADFAGSSRALALTAISMADAFISCWDEKYRSNLIRPETVINRYLDPDWTPLLETPPFPEYTSGHSVVSSAASELLSALFGEPFVFIDSSEVRYGLPPRPFSSFRQAAEEACISRLYGGIHYMPAITEGRTQGIAVGLHVRQHLLPQAGSQPLTESQAGAGSQPQTESQAQAEDQLQTEARPQSSQSAN